MSDSQNPQAVAMSSVSSVSSLQVPKTQQKYLLRISLEYKLTRDELDHLIDIKQSYQSSFPALLKLRDRGISLRDIDLLLQVRENFVDHTETQGDNRSKPSLKKIAELHEAFPCAVIDPDILVPLIKEIHGRLGQKFIDSSLAIVIARAEESGCVSPEAILDCFPVLEKSDDPNFDRSNTNYTS